MLKVPSKNKCSGCSACVSICPVNCIKLVEDQEGFLYPKVDDQKCVKCGACVKTCPYNNEQKGPTDKKAFAVINKDQHERMESSSGGVFSLLAKDVIKKGGVVFGACFNQDYKLEHLAIDSEKDVYKLRGAKYVQSDMNDAFNKAKEFLDNGRLVLFTGTPCQIAGLKGYLKKEYQNLITQDIICHGVPSPMVWRKYLNYRTMQSGAKITKISTRCKNDGWRRYSVAFTFENGKEYERQHDLDPYSRVFLKNLCLRPSCYSCNFNGDKRLADITLADFWGIEKVQGEMDDDKGTSLVIINTPKGEQAFDNIKENVVYIKVPFEDSIKHNPSYHLSVVEPNNRTGFMQTIAQKDFSYAYDKYAKDSFGNKIKKIIKKIFRKLFRR